MKVPCPRKVPRGTPSVMGILNLTPDSFSDGGRWTDADAAIRHAFEMVDSGADIIDIGAESTRPGSVQVSADSELERLVPVLRELVPSLSVPVSVDTMKAEVAERCIDLGIDIVNDVYGLRDPRMAEVCAEGGVGVVIMHAEGVPGDFHGHTMEGAFKDSVRGFLRERVQVAIDAGVGKDRIILDPGIGFGKTPEQNSAMVDDMAFFSDGYPVLSAPSRKRFLSHRYPGMDPDDATVLAVLDSIRSGADIVRVHDVARTVDALVENGLRR